ncbi:MAG: L,D-transpeptidase [Chitinophagaceae bacterium]|jgi:hypothetical protein|nr:L,D-transpeptidase [Chitinophagaceae bacterium]
MKSCKTLIVFLSVWQSLSPSQSYAQFWGARQPRPIETPKDSLKKGEFTWAPQLAPKGPILVTVSVDDQMAYTFRNGVLIGVASASTGKKGHGTPTGVFHTTLKDAKHRSSKYNNAPMPYTQRFTSSGIALHAGGLPGYPSSHGCVHLPSEYARLLFNEAPLGMTVVVTNNTRFPDAVDHPAFLSPVSTDGKVQAHERLSSSETYRWKPELSPEGPVSMLISRADKRLVVVRNGQEIGRCKVTIANEKDSVGTRVFVAHTNGVPDNAAYGSIRWMSHELADVHYGSGTHGDAAGSLSRIKIPDAFLVQIQPLLVEGTTMIITDAPILRKTSGKEMAVISSHPGA